MRGQEWLADALAELAGIDEDIEADGLPPIPEAARAEAARILRAVHPHPAAPAVYPAPDGIVLHFKAPGAPASVVLEIGDDGRGACFAHIGGRSRSKSYASSSEIPDDFVRERLRELAAVDAEGAMGTGSAKNFPARRTPVGDPSRPRPDWLADALTELGAIDAEIEEEGLPPVSAKARAEAVRILEALDPLPEAPTVYPARGRIVLSFKARHAPAGVVIEIDSDGRGSCYAHIGGKNRSKLYASSSEIPDGFVREQLQELAVVE